MKYFGKKEKCKFYKSECVFGTKYFIFDDPQRFLYKVQ